MNYFTFTNTANCNIGRVLWSIIKVEQGYSRCLLEFTLINLFIIWVTVCYIWPCVFLIDIKILLVYMVK